MRNDEDNDVLFVQSDIVIREEEYTTLLKMMNID